MVKPEIPQEIPGEIPDDPPTLRDVHLLKCPACDHGLVPCTGETLRGEAAKYKVQTCDVCWGKTYATREDVARWRQLHPGGASKVGQ
jgi:hypothetical protein